MHVPARSPRTSIPALCLTGLLLAGCTGGSSDSGGPSTGTATSVAPGAATGAVATTAAATEDAGARVGGDASVRDRPVQACDVLTRERAEQILGSVADLPTSATTGTADGDLAVTSCSYLAADRDEDDVRTAVGLVVRTALSAAGVAANRDRFSAEERPADAEPVDDLGEQAFWAPEVGQLNVLADDQWYVVTYGGLDPRANTLEETLAAAEVLAVDLATTTSSTDPEGATP